MRESNQLHALCLDTWPPCTYLSHTSHCIMTFVHQINKHFKRNFVAYTFDAGANAFLLVELKNIPIILRYLTECFGCPLEVCDSAVDPESSAIHSSNNSTKHLKITGIPYTLSSDPVDQSLLEKLPCNHGGILYVISTEVGDGPQLISFVEDD
ncbi:unnamed protein product [Heterobilharzia americana]|nr:unnamed protein product [Heterobilharzia americana]